MTTVANTANEFMWTISQPKKTTKSKRSSTASTKKIQKKFIAEDNISKADVNKMIEKATAKLISKIEKLERIIAQLDIKNLPLVDEDTKEVSLSSETEETSYSQDIEKTNEIDTPAEAVSEKPTIAFEYEF